MNCLAKVTFFKKTYKNAMVTVALKEYLIQMFTLCKITEINSNINLLFRSYQVLE